MLKLGTLALGAITAIALVACGGDGEPTGTVHLALESSGSTSSNIESVDVRLAGVDVHIGHTNDDVATDNEEEGGSWLSTNERPGTINLLDLRNQMDEELGELVAHGPITQVRLRIEAMGGSRVVFKDGRSCPIDTSSIGSAGIRVIHPFFVVEPEEGHTRIVLDIDVKESLIEVAPCAYVLRPVLRVSRVER